MCEMGYSYSNQDLGLLLQTLPLGIAQEIWSSLSSGSKIKRARIRPIKIWTDKWPKRSKFKNTAATKIWTVVFKVKWLDLKSTVICLPLVKGHSTIEFFIPSKDKCLNKVQIKPMCSPLKWSQPFLFFFCFRKCFDRRWIPGNLDFSHSVFVQCSYPNWYMQNTARSKATFCSTTLKVQNKIIST